jgi:trk system potassium uptake protein TrkA
MNVVGTIGTGEVDCMGVEVTPLLVGRTVSQLNVPGEFNVIAISRRGKTILPSSGTVFEEGDLIHLAILSTSTERLKKMLE